uniref:Uncharacterized protein n=1 Tax=Meloidogyne enterolobii TaxID=390850 RepID=A0A6V7WLK7_MELEN|nr:unnamed protein product [Meloidogyne enterolobii]
MFFFDCSLVIFTSFNTKQKRLLSNNSLVLQSVTFFCDACMAWNSCRRTGTTALLFIFFQSSFYISSSYI